jgi:hypothetical protein
MPHDIIEIDSDSDVPVSRPPKPVQRTVVPDIRRGVTDGSDIAWDTLDDGWVDRIMKEGRER